ncbi:MAG: hypothetical protein ABI621_11500 [Chloroflexota bacterium]
MDEGYCSAAAVEIDPDTGCATYSPTDGVVAAEAWDEEESEEWEEDDADEEDDDLWEEEEDEF